MSLFDRVVRRGLPLIPHAVVHRVARRYVAGAEIADALRAVAELNAEGAMATVDVLGEALTRPEQAVATAEEYLRLIDALSERGLASHISVKPTAIGLKVDAALCREQLTRIAQRAAEQQMFVRLDMEDHSCTDATLRLYEAVQPVTGNLGVVLQAMLHRTLDDAERLAQTATNVRLCKGIYREPPEIAFQDREEVRRAFLATLHRLLAGGCYVGIATHDVVLVRASLQALHKRQIARDRYEFQMLLGVLPRLRRQLLADGHRLRVYVPYGSDWYGYCVRRLRENPAIAQHVLKAMFD